MGSPLPRLVVLVLAVAASARAQALDPDTEVARRRFRVGAAAYERGDYDRALAEFELARRAKPLPALDYNIARCLDRLERYPEAIEAYQRFVDAVDDPFDAEEARDRVAVLRSRVGTAAVPKVTEADAEAQRLLDRGTALFRAGRLVDARNLFERLHRRMPENANALRWLGMTLARLGRCAEAVTSLDAFLERIAEDDPRVAEAVTIRERCQAELGPNMGTLVVETSPPGAEVVLDDELSRPLGHTPFRIERIAAGTHTIYLRRKGHRSVTKSVAIGRKETVRLDVALRPIEGTVVVPLPAPAPPAPPDRAPSRAPPTASAAPPSSASGRRAGRELTIAAAGPGGPEVTPPAPAEEPSWRAAAPAPRRAEGALAPDRSSFVAPIVVGVSALALAATGGALLVAVKLAYDDLEESCAPACPPDRWSALPAQEVASYGLLGGAGVALVVDVVLWSLAARRRAGGGRAAIGLAPPAPEIGPFVLIPNTTTPGLLVSGTF